MTIDINNISINTAEQGFTSWLDYADLLQELANELQAFLNTYRDDLDSSQKASLRFGISELRHKAREIATIAAIKALEDLHKEAELLRTCTEKIDGLVRSIKNIKAIISGIAEILTVITDILKVVR